MSRIFGGPSRTDGDNRACPACRQAGDRRAPRPTDGKLSPTRRDSGGALVSTGSGLAERAGHRRSADGIGAGGDRLRRRAGHVARRFSDEGVRFEVTRKVSTDNTTLSTDIYELFEKSIRMEWARLAVSAVKDGPHAALRRPTSHPFLD